MSERLGGGEEVWKKMKRGREGERIDGNLEGERKRLGGRDVLGRLHLQVA